MVERVVIPQGKMGIFGIPGTPDLGLPSIPGLPGGGGFPDIPGFPDLNLADILKPISEPFKLIGKGFVGIGKGAEALVNFLITLGKFLSELIGQLDDMVRISIRVGEVMLIVTPAVTLIYYGSEVIERIFNEKVEK